LRYSGARQAAEGKRQISRCGFHGYRDTGEWNGRSQSSGSDGQRRGIALQRNLRRQRSESRRLSRSVSGQSAGTSGKQVAGS
jgi:hypothetical protein